MSSIWISEEEKKELIKKIKKQDVEDPLFDGGRIEELYIDKDTGAIYGGEKIGRIFVGINIPFETWIEQFLKFDSFDAMLTIIETRQEDIKKIKKKLQKIREKT